ncbi:MAG: nucleotide exchange factor GrpE [Alphaproteobacteria bacterium]|nr:nucleotide exchange factor GrpE [Alphaproteobacteria bacterium]
MPSEPAGRPDPANDTAPAGAPDAMAEPLAEAAARIAALESEVAALKDQYLRAVAETDNVRRRGDRERQDALKYGASSFAKDMLSVADNLRRALDALPPEARSEERTRAFVDGVELTERELLAAMGRHGIERVAPLDVPFDHHRHQAMFEVPGTGKPAGTVVQCLQPGYVMHDRLLRPALVGVAKDAPAPQAAAPTPPVGEDEPSLG